MALRIISQKKILDSQGRDDEFATGTQGFPGQSINGFIGSRDLEIILLQEEANILERNGKKGRHL
jgi:hypothetical protein